MLTTEIFDAIRTHARQDGRDHAAGILAAYEIGAMHEAFKTLDDIADAWADAAAEYVCDVLPDVIPDAWAEWTAGEWTQAVDESARYAMRYYRDHFIDGFRARVHDDTARWYAVAMATRGAR